jgi:succinate dehydrogenase / fumarate reductase membrane anchor subunit
MSLRSPLGRVLGLGSARDGTSHWWGQRMSAIALVLLGSWFVISLAMMPGFEHSHAAAFIGQPLNAVLLMLLSVAMAYHSWLGVQVVVEDYVHSHGLKLAALVISRFAHIFLAVVALFAILRLGIGS